MVKYFMRKIKIQDYLRKVLSKTELPDEIIAIYLFGSAINRRLRRDSDIDIALLLLPDTGQERTLEIITFIEDIVTRNLHKLNLLNEVSVINLREPALSYLLLFKILTEGVLIYEKPSMRLERRDFENAATGKYFDFVQYYKRAVERRYALSGE